MLNGRRPLISTPLASVVVRTKGEERYLRELLRRLKEQTFQNFETILVVDYRSDETLETISDLAVDQLVPLKHDQFNHAYSTNLGVAASRGKLVAITNGHSLPISKHWLERGVRHFSASKIAGVTGLYTPHADGSLWEKIYYSPVLVRLYRKRWIRLAVDGSGRYLFSTTNCMIRRALWESYPFDESLPQCEDYDWGLEMEARGYSTIIDPEFSVYHSHGEGLAEILSRQRRWEVLTQEIDSRPRPRASFTRLSVKKPSPAITSAF